jgi:Fe-S-cluster containining protein
MEKPLRKSVVVDGVRYNVMENACKHLRGAKCSIYDRRPQMCRDFPANDEIKKLWKAIHPECGMV